MTIQFRSAIPEHLRKAELAISNAMNDAEISKLLESSGYDRAKFESGKALLDIAKTTVNAEITADGAQSEVTAAVKIAEIAAREAFQALAQVAKEAFGREMLAALGLSSAMPHACSAFLTAGYVLFDNAQKLPDIQARLASYGYDNQKIIRERDKISEYARADYALEAAKSAVLKAADTRNKAQKEFNDWFADFMKIAKEGLHEKKQLLEKLGIVARTKG